MSTAIVELVAKNNVSFFVHKGILDHHSQPFKDATSGPLTESVRHRFLLQDWDEATVGRLVQFMYTGNYRYPGPGPDDELISPVEEEEGIEPNRPEPRRGGTLTPLNEYVNDGVLGQADPIMCDAEWLERVNVNLFDFEEVFLAHVSVYTLAHNQSIAVLKELSYERLSRTILQLHPLGPNPYLAENIVNLATYVYANLIDEEEPLRILVSQFVGSNFTRWHEDPAAVKMMCNGGDFIRDVLRKICRRLEAGGEGGLKIAPLGMRFIAQLTVGLSRLQVAPCVANDCKGRHPRYCATGTHP